MFIFAGINTPIWIDLYYATTWEHSNKAVTYTNWMEGEPHVDGIARYTVMLGTSRLWDDYNDSLSSGVFCEKNLS